MRENPFNAVMMMEQIAIAAAIQEAEEEAQAEKEALEKVKNGTAATSTETPSTRCRRRPGPRRGPRTTGGSGTSCTLGSSCSAC